MKSVCLVLSAAFALGFLHNGKASAENAYSVFGKNVSVDEVKKDNKSAFFDLDKKKFEIVSQAANEAYLTAFFEKMAKKDGVSVDVARNNYIDKNLNVSDKEVQETLDKFKDHPQLSKLPKAEQQQQVKDYLKGRDQRVLFEKILTQGIAKGDLKVMVAEPEEPVYNVQIEKDDFVRYGPKPDDIKPVGCKTDCPITVVEYSEFECPFCARVMPDVKRVLTDYKGKIRWVTRDFPLSFHQRARPAAIVAYCAGQQDKFWHMYTKLFDNQQNLSDEDFEKYAKDIGVYNSDYKKCVSNPEKALAKIDANMASGADLGVSGTPAFFVNGRRLSGAIPYAQFKQVIDAELAAQK